MTENKKIKVAVIGMGNRMRDVVSRLLIQSNNGVEIVSAFDPDKEVCKSGIEFLKVTNDVKVCDDYKQAVDFPGVEWVMIFSPNSFHKEHILYSFAAKKHVFTEKPLATEIMDCQEIFEAHQKSGLLFATGFVLRYAPLYRTAKEILDSGKLGKILSIDANENITPDHGGYILCNWRRHKSLAGPHILEKCCHDMDLINWFCQSVPSKIAAFGGLDFFVPENECMLEKYGYETFVAWGDPHRVRSPFTSDKDMLDNQVAIMQYRNNIRVMFQATMSNVIPERRMYFSCTEGNMIVELYSGKLEYRCLGEKYSHVLNVSNEQHGGGDNVIMRELYETMTKHVAPKCSGNEGLESAVVALCIDKSCTEGAMIDLEPIWKQLNR